MAGVTISYKGSQIASMTSTGTKTLTTSGQYCEDNITVGYSAPSLESITINAGNLLSQNTTFDTPNLVLYENNNFSKSQAVPSYVKWFDSFTPINLNEKIHLYMNISFLCSDIDETIIIDCDYTVSESVTSLSFTSSSQSSNIKYFNIYYYNSNELRFGFAKNNGNVETVQITGQIIVTKVVDGIDTINLNLIDNPQYLNIYKSLAYRSIISASAQGVSEWCNSLSVINSQQFMGQPLSGNFVFNNVTKVNQYAFVWNYVGGFGGGTGDYTFTFPKLTSFNNYTAFAYNRGLTSIYCPLVSSISSNTFYCCNDLTNISFPVCTVIGSSAFQDCSKLTTVSFPSCITIYNYAFSYCTKLTSVSFPVCTSIGYGAFLSCSKLETAVFPSCISINGYAFSGCSSLTTASFPVCTTISNNAFANCNNLVNISFPVCTLISYGAFTNCSSLTSAIFSVCTLISAQVFYNCYNLANISFPVCTVIGSSAFQNCSKLTNINFPSCTIISGSAFRQCISLTTVNFPSCTIIETSAFYYCSNLTNVSFPACTSINNYAFSGCSKLSQAYFMGSSIVSAGTSIFQNTPMQYSTYLGYFGSIYVPSSLLNSYKTATNWTKYSIRMVGI